MDKYQEFIEACKNANIHTKDEAAMFLAQVLYESKGFTSLKENDSHIIQISKQRHGDYIGRGYIRISGLSNYRQASEALDIDCVNNPSLIETDPHAWNVTCWFWRTNIQKHVHNGLHATTQFGMRATLASNQQRAQIYRKVCIALGVNPIIY